MAYTATGSEAQPDIGVDTVDTDSHDRVRQLHEQLIQGDILQYLGYERDALSHLLDRDKRSEIFQRLMEKREDVFPGVAAKQLKKDLDVLSEYLDTLAFMQRAHKSYKQDTQSPEKAGMFQRAFESVKGFAKRHPVVTTLLAAAAVVGSAAAGYYLAANIEAAAAQLGRGHLFGAEGAAEGTEALGEVIDGGAAVPDYIQGPGAKNKF